MSPSGSYVTTRTDIRKIFKPCRKPCLENQHTIASSRPHVRQPATPGQTQSTCCLPATSTRTATKPSLPRDGSPKPLPMSCTKQVEAGIEYRQRWRNGQDLVLAIRQAPNWTALPTARRAALKKTSEADFGQPPPEFCRAPRNWGGSESRPGTIVDRAAHFAPPMCRYGDIPGHWKRTWRIFTAATAGGRGRPMRFLNAASPGVIFVVLREPALRIDGRLRRSTGRCDATGNTKAIVDGRVQSATRLPLTSPAAGTWVSSI